MALLELAGQAYEFFPIAVYVRHLDLRVGGRGVVLRENGLEGFWVCHDLASPAEGLDIGGGRGAVERDGLLKCLRADGEPAELERRADKDHVGVLQQDPVHRLLLSALADLSNWTAQ